MVSEMNHRFLPAWLLALLFVLILGGFTAFYIRDNPPCPECNKRVLCKIRALPSTPGSGNRCQVYFVCARCGIVWETLIVEGDLDSPHPSGQKSLPRKL